MGIEARAAIGYAEHRNSFAQLRKLNTLPITWQPDGSHDNLPQEQQVANRNQVTVIDIFEHPRLVENIQRVSSLTSLRGVQDAASGKRLHEVASPLGGQVLLGYSDVAIPSSSAQITNNEIASPFDSLRVYKDVQSEASESSRFTTEMQEIAMLQKAFDKALGREHDPEDLLRRSFNPVVHRWHVEMLMKRKDYKGLEALKNEIRKDMETNLMERLHAVESYGKFMIIGDQLYSEYFPDESFSDIFQRGAFYREQLGSIEAEREGWRGELAGWDLIRRTLTDPNKKVGTKIFSFSPRGDAKVYSEEKGEWEQKTEYTGRFVDKFELLDSQTGRYVKRTRMAVDFDEEQYRQKALEFDENFFDNYDGRDIGAWYLSHPVESDKDIFAEEKKGLDPQVFQAIYAKCRQIIEESYILNLYNPTVDWLQLALSFNAICNKADDERDAILSKLQEVDSNKRAYVLHTYNVQEENLSDYQLRRQVQNLGVRPVQEVGGGGCPTNKGYDLSSILGETSLSTINSNSVAQFGIEANGMCKCGKSSSDNHYHCHKCNTEHESELGKAQSEWRKECKSCHAKFGCATTKVKKTSTEEVATSNEDVDKEEKFVPKEQTNIVEIDTKEQSNSEVEVVNIFYTGSNSQLKKNVKEKELVAAK